MKRGTLNAWIGGIMLMAGVVLVATVVVGFAASTGPRPTPKDLPAESVPMIDPFTLKILWVSQTPPSPEGKEPPESVAVDMGGTIRIPDRPVVRSVFKPSP